jgi:hypothetical protein
MTRRDDTWQQGDARGSTKASAHHKKLTSFMRYAYVTAIKNLA